MFQPVIKNQLLKTSKRLFGFTLIELLVVIAIIGVLAAMATTAYGDSQRKARDNRRKADLQAIKKALELYKADSPGGYSYPRCQDSLGNLLYDGVAQYTTSQPLNGWDGDGTPGPPNVWQSGCHFDSTHIQNFANYLPSFPQDPNPNSYYPNYGYYTYTNDGSGNLTPCPSTSGGNCNNPNAFRLVACLENLKDPQRDEIKPDGTFNQNLNLKLFCFSSGFNAFKTKSYSVWSE